MKEIKNKLYELSLKLLFELNEDEIEIIANNFDNIQSSFELIKNINLENVEPMSFVEPIRLENVINDDEFVDYDSSKSFSNCKFFKDNMVEIKNEK